MGDDFDSFAMPLLAFVATFALIRLVLWVL